VGVNRHRPPAANADGEGDRGGPDDAGEGEQQHRAQVGRGAEWSVSRRRGSDQLPAFVKGQDEQKVHGERQTECRRHPGELAEGILGRRERRAVQEIPDADLVVADHRQARHQGSEEGVGEEARDREALGQGMRGVDEGALATHRDLARWDHRHRVEGAGDEEHDPEQGPERRAGELSPDFVPGDRRAAGRVQETARNADAAGASPAFRVRTR
jgi:hypothetical protein